MNKQEKRNYIGQHIDISHARLTDNEADTLCDLIKNYDSYKGKSKTETRTSPGICSEGKFTRTDTLKFSFDEDSVAIRCDYSYVDDDGESGSSTNTISDARGILSNLKHLK